MTDKEKENYKSILKDINQKMPMGEDCYDYRGAVVAHRFPTKFVWFIVRVSYLGVQRWLKQPHK